MLKQKEIALTLFIVRVSADEGEGGHRAMDVECAPHALRACRQEVSFEVWACEASRSM